MSTRRHLRDFVRLNPDEGPTVQHLGGGQFVPRSSALVRELGGAAALALVDENHGSPQDRTAAIIQRATLAQQRGEHREALLEWRFAALNPEFDVAPSRTNPEQHGLAHRYERLLALGRRVALAEARENNGNPELAAALIRERARYARYAARHPQPRLTARSTTARAGAER
jgi:hypothetical protein